MTYTLKDGTEKEEWLDIGQAVLSDSLFTQYMRKHGMTVNAKRNTTKDFIVVKFEYGVPEKKISARELRKEYYKNGITIQWPIYDKDTGQATYPYKSIKYKMLMRSPVMERSLGRISDEEKEASSSVLPEEQIDFELKYYEVNEELEIPGTGICTDRGEAWVFGIIIRDPGIYHLTMKVSAEGGELAQIPVSVFLNGGLKGSITLNGTEGKVVETEQSLGEIFFPNNYIRIYFAQSGMKIRCLKIWKEKGD